MTMGARRITLGIVDDHQVLLDGLSVWIRECADDVEIAIASPTWAGLLSDPHYPVDVVLLDLELNDGIPVPVKIATLRSAGVAVVVISAFGESRNVTECLTAGALAFVPKTECAEHLLEAVRSAAVGRAHLMPAAAAALVPDDPASPTPALSPQERRALILYASGLPMKSVARRLGVSFDTAKCYVDRVREKYARSGREARTKIELRRRAVEDGLLDERAEELGRTASG